MALIDNFKKLRASIPDHVKVVAVSKFNPGSSIELLYRETGLLDFGESRVQELLMKAPHLPSQLHGHFIGHLQTNKIRSLLPYTHLIHSVDSYRLLKEINREAHRLEKTMNILLQFHIGQEETKYGLSLEEACQLLEDKEFPAMKNIRICGVMGMASLTEDLQQVRKEFAFLRRCFEQLKNDYFFTIDSFSELSMGMSGDYQIAVEEGSTMVRIGSILFGDR